MAESNLQVSAVVRVYVGRTRSLASYAQQSPLRLPNHKHRQARRSGGVEGTLKLRYLGASANEDFAVPIADHAHSVATFVGEL